MSPVGGTFARMLRLRADPWDPGYGMGYEMSSEEDIIATFPQVEGLSWTSPRATAAPEEPIWFVDGVRRVDLRVVAEGDGGARIAGLFGTYAVGAVVCAPGAASIASEEVGRRMVLGGGQSASRVLLTVGAATLDFEPASDPSGDPNAPVWRLQQAMRDHEARLAVALAASEGLVVVDGPLNLADPSGAEIVGMTKRLVKHYLEGEQAALLPLLVPGARTPLFGIGDSQAAVQRYAWYTRLRAPEIHHHDLSGIVRCEVAEGLGVERAAQIADRVTALLPRYAGRPSDPRSPQNLLPVAALEDRLRRGMGHALKIRRALTTHLIEEARSWMN